MFNCKVVACLIALQGAWPLNLSAQQIAFPGADGFGKYTTGGRGGRVIEVTSLNDNGPGSLRDAIRRKGSRTIVFRVSGTINLQTELKVNNGDLTIAGQTAPGDGITLANHSFVISANNVIVRFIRCRLGDLSQSQEDAFTVTGSNSVIIDHCSFSWSVDEVASCYKNSNTTMQWCIISESMAKSSHAKGEHGYGGIWGGSKASFHHNLLAHNSSRNPRFNGARFAANWNEHVDFRNNVIYNWGFNSAYGGEPSETDGAKAKINMVNNYFKPGPATKKGKVYYRILEPLAMKNFGYSFWHIDGNYMEGNDQVTKDNWGLGVQEVSYTIKKAIRSDSPFEYIIETNHSALQAYELVLHYAGCVRPKIDAVDARIINEVRSGTATFGGSWGKNSGIIDSQKDVGGWPELESIEPPADSDHDGMPDEWETRHKLNMNDPSDGSLYTLSKEYTNLEVYLNGLASLAVK